MSRLTAPLRAVERHLPGALIPVVAIIATGILLGQQYAHPNHRVIAVMIAVILASLAWRIDMLWGIGVLVLAVPYPRGTTFGSSNVALILVLFIIWLLRTSQRQSQGFRQTPVDLPMVGLLVAYVVSFYNVRPQPDLGYALQNLALTVACMLLFYLIVSNVRTTRALRRFHLFQAISLLTILLLSVYELTHPGEVFIHGWIGFKGTVGDEFNLNNVRVGGPFFDYELMAEFTALNVLLVVFLFARAASRTQQVIYGGLFLFTVFILFTTVTRGAVISLAAGVLYMLWIARRQIQFVPFVVGVSAVVALFLGMNMYVSTYTRSGDLIDRLLGTHFVGLAPENRLRAWTDGWERFLQHPIIGHGPYYSAQTGTRTWYWPHNGYLLVANMVGVVGLAFYLWIVGRLLWVTRPIVESLRAPSYAASFLIVGHVQLILFMIDQMKIDFLRNDIYLFEVWIMFAGITSAHLIVRDQQARAALEATGTARPQRLARGVTGSIPSAPRAGGASAALRGSH